MCTYVSFSSLQEGVIIGFGALAKFNRVWYYFLVAHKYHVFGENMMVVSEGGDNLEMVSVSTGIDFKYLKYLISASKCFVTGISCKIREKPMPYQQQKIKI